MVEPPKKAMQLAAMSLAHVYPGTKVEAHSWVGFMAAIKGKRVLWCCILEEVPEPAVYTDKGDSQFPWWIAILVVLGVCRLFRYNKILKHTLKCPQSPGIPLQPATLKLTIVRPNEEDS